MDNVTLLGFVSGKDLKEIVGNAKAVILPSEWYENGPYSAIEAMALGKPLIVSNNGGLPELIDGNGYIFFDKDDFIRSIEKIIIICNEKYNAMCKKSYVISKKAFSPDRYTNKIIGMI